MIFKEIIMKNLRCAILLIFISALARLHTTSANFLSEDNIMSGIMFPEQIIVKEGSDINMKLANAFAAPQICNYRVPRSNVIHEIGSDPRITKWENELCGILVKNVSVADAGFWALSSKRDNDYIRGVLMVVVTPKTGEAGMKDTVQEMDYCVVSRPDEIAFPQIGSCKIPNDMPGEWTLHKGLQGQNQEVTEEVYHEPLGNYFLEKIR